MGKIISMKKYREAMQTLKKITNEEYEQALMEIAAYQVALQQDCKVPDFNYDSDYIKQTKKVFEEIQTILDVWVNQIYENLKTYPVNLCTTTMSMKNYLTNASNDISALLENGYNSTLAADLKMNVQLSQNVVSGTKKRCDNIYNVIVNFKDTQMVSVSEKLAEMIKLMQASEEVDNKKVQELNDAIKALNDDITKNAVAIAGCSLADLVIIGSVVLVGIAGGAMVGFAAAAFLGIPFVVASTYIALDSEEIVADKKLIEIKQSQLNLYEQDLSVMQTLESTYQTYIEKTDALTDQFSTVAKAWGDIQKDVDNIKIEIDAALEDMANGVDTGREKALEIQAEIQEALTVTADLLEKAENVIIHEPTVSLAQVEPGMSQAELDAAISEAGKIPYSLYILAY